MSLQHEEIGNNKILFFYKTKLNSDAMEYSAMIYDYETDEELWSGDTILWQNTENFNWDIVHKLVHIDTNRFIAVNFAEEDGHYKHQQTLEYRILTLNLK